MEIKVNQVKPSENSKRKKIQTFLFLDILVKFCYFPITISSAKVTFKFCSCRILISKLPLLLHIIFLILSPIKMELEGLEATDSLAMFCLALVNLIIKLSNLFISFGLQFIQPKRLQIVKKNSRQNVKLLLGKIL